VSAPVAAPHCPRCGYDLVGDVATWRDSCPLAGTCTECGLLLEWGRVFAISVHPWLFEYHWRRGPLRRLASTALHALAPRSFWRDVRMTDPIHLRPAACVALACIGAALLAVFARSVQIQVGWTRFLASQRAGGLRAWLAVFADAAVDAPLRILSDGGTLLIALAAMPLLFLLLPATLRRARVRRAHVLRIWIYSLVCPALLGATYLAVYVSAAAFGAHGFARAIDPWRWIPWRAAQQSIDLMVLRALLPRLFLVAIFLAWVVPWWWIAGDRYLKLERPGAIAVLLGTIVALAATLVETLRAW
jgi:hypothetical protein